jgi:hypothetical protein
MKIGSNLTLKSQKIKIKWEGFNLESQQYIKIRKIKRFAFIIGKNIRNYSI